MSDLSIKAEGLSKRYRIGQYVGAKFQYRALRDVLADAMYAPFRGMWARNKQGAVGSGPSSSSSQWIWALKDVSFEVKQGEVIGIVGRNGAGKTTLLKVIYRITEPTEGRAKIRGRVGSLLEVGTGFHPELTGWENIYLSGAILGMTRNEIKRKFDEIVAFAELEEFISTPVKRYSRGMWVRLGFAVAAHLEPEILLVDEVLAVGDVEFQQKCLGKMEDVSRAGRTILFVSHNTGAIGRLCRKTMLISKGRIMAFGDTDAVLDTYLSSTFGFDAERDFPQDNSKQVQIRRLSVSDKQGEMTTTFDVQHPFATEIEYEVKDNAEDFRLTWMLSKPDGTRVCESTDLDARTGRYLKHQPGRHIAKIQFPGGVLNAGTYTIRVGIANRGGDTLDHQYGFRVNLQDRGSFVSAVSGGGRRGLLLLNLPWKIVPLEGQASR